MMNEKTEQQASRDSSKNVNATLTDLVENNHQIITVLGVFVVLTVFASSISLPIIRSLLSFFFFSLALLVWLEMFLNNKVSPSATWRLRTFNQILDFTIPVLFLYLLIGFIETSAIFLVLLLMVPIISILIIPIRKFELYKKLTITDRLKLRPLSSLLKNLAWIAMVVVLIIVSFYIASIIGAPIIKFLKELKHQMEIIPQ